MFFWSNNIQRQCKVTSSERTFECDVHLQRDRKSIFFLWLINEPSKKKEKKRNFDIKSPSGCINPMEVELRGLNNSSHSVEDLIFSWRKVFFFPFPSHEILACGQVSEFGTPSKRHDSFASADAKLSFVWSIFGRRKKTAHGLKWMRGFSFSSPPPPLPSPHPPPVSVQITAVLNTSKLPRAAQHFLEPSPVGNSKLNRLLNRRSLEIIC